MWQCRSTVQWSSRCWRLLQARSMHRTRSESSGIKLFSSFRESTCHEHIVETMGEFPVPQIQKQFRKSCLHLPIQEKCVELISSFRNTTFQCASLNKCLTFQSAHSGPNVWKSSASPSSRRRLTSQSSSFHKRTFQCASLNK